MNLPIVTCKNVQGPSLGAAILAMVGGGEYENVADACRTIVAYDNEYLPDNLAVEKYEIKYRKFVRLYPALRDLS